MEGSREKGLSHRRGAAASRMAAVGKENICPALSSKEHLNASRSPLPEGFPRAPLQDITHILNPINILPTDDDGDAMELGQCRRAHKRSKCVAETQTSSCVTRSKCELVSSAAWRGLRKCVMLEAANSDVHVVTGESTLTEGVANSNVAHLAENNPEDAAELTNVEAEGDMLLCHESGDTEVFKTESLEASSLAKSSKAKMKGSVRPSLSKPSTRASLRSPQEKQKLSTLMKFR